MTKMIRKQTAFLILLISAAALSACSPDIAVDPNATAIAVMGPGGQGIDGDRAPTIAHFLTESAQLTQAAGGTVNGTPNPLTPFPTQFAVPVVLVADAECRYGPAAYFGIVLTLFAGEGATVLGVEPGGGWYYIETQSLVRCWVLASLVSSTETGGTITLPVITPPATPIATLTPTAFPTTVQDIGTPAP
jgi:hypothetical protein